MPTALLLLPLAIALAVAGPRLGDRAVAMSGWLGWVVAGGILLGLPSIPPHSALDYRMVLAPLLLVPMLATRRWAVAGLTLAAVLLLGFGLQSLWGRLSVWESAAIGTLTLAGLLGLNTLVERPQRAWVVPLLGIGVGIVLALNHSVRLGMEALVIGGVALCLQGHAALNRGALLALAGVLAAGCAYAEALPSLALILCSALSIGVLRQRSVALQVLGAGLPLVVACVPGLIDLMRSPL